MCGILITDDSDKKGLISHRGTDFGEARQAGRGFIHWRLPIQTVEGDQWGQPIYLDKGGLMLFNGEIFNYPKAFGSDTEYLAALFNDGGLSRVLSEAQDWDGFWAIAFAEGNDIYCFTDPLGKKQLYYNAKGEICSEIRPLIRTHERYDQLFKSSVFKWGYNTDDRTPFQGIRRVIPNRLYHFQKNQLLSIAPEDYFRWVPMNTEKVSLKWLLIQAVQRRLMSKTYKIGALVSGGLDSSIIAKILCDLGAEVSFYSVDNDEKEYVEILEDFLGIKADYIKFAMGMQEPGDDHLKSLEFNETPIDLGSLFPQHELMKAIPETVVLTGDGADELFGGYKRAREYDSQYSDIFQELPYYHLPRLDRASMRFTKELRNPFLSHEVVRFALGLPYNARQDKAYLKRIYSKDLPEEILNREKRPLKNREIVKDPNHYRRWIFDKYYNDLNLLGL